jgi:tetratricopeptide (TPR) repeat protein
MTFNDFRKRIEDSYVFYGAVIFFATFLVFGKATNNDFVNFDDPAFVLENPMVVEISIENLKEIFTSLHTANWQPLTWLSHSLDYFLFGANPQGHHFTSVFIHGLNAILIFLLFELISRITFPETHNIIPIRYTGLVVAILFAIHPLRAESVVWVSERKDLLCAFFVLLAYRSYIFFHSQRVRETRRGWPISALFFSMLALMAKPMAVTIPVVLLIFDLFPLKRVVNVRGILRLGIEKWPFFILSLSVGLITIFGQKKVGALAPITDLSFFERGINSLYNVFFYLGKTFFPLNLAPFYPYAESLTVWTPKFVVTLFFFLGISIFCFIRWREGQKYWGAAWLYYLIVIAPVVGLVQVGSQGAADRYTYLPTLSLYFLIGFIFLYQIVLQKSGAQKKGIFFLVSTFGVLLFICFASVAVKQVKVWENGETLWRRNIEVFPKKQADVYRMLGDVLRTQKRYREGEVMFKTALEIKKDYSAALSGLGLLYLEEERWKESERYLSHAVEKDPKNVESKINLGLVYLYLKDYKKSQSAFELALKLDPDSWETLNNLGKLFIEMKRFEKAETFLKRADVAGNNRAEVKANLGLVYYETGRLLDAEIQLVSALKIQPENLKTYLLLAAVYIQTGLYEQAEKELHFVLSQDEKNEVALDNLHIISERRRLESLKKKNEPKQ